MSIGLLFYISEWIIRLVMLGVVTQRRQPSSAALWLIIIFAQPWIGLVLYVLIGENTLPRRRLKKHTQLLEKLDVIRQRFRSHPNVVRPDVGPATRAVRLVERLGFLAILGGNQIEFISSSEKFVERLIADIEGAKEHVHLLFYIFADDATGRRVADALAGAVERGVACRVLVDAVGSNRLIGKLGERMKQQGVEVHTALPVTIFRRFVQRIDLRNHRKLAVIDGHVAYTGSQNIVDESYGHADLAWRDLMARITGPIVLQLQSVFIGDWYMETDQLLDDASTFPDPCVTGDANLQTLPSGPVYPTENYQRLVVTALHNARRHVIITTPYFVPDQAFLEAIEIAVLRGVEVEIVVPRRSDQILVGTAARAYYEQLLEYGVKLHLFTDGLVHAKTMTVDDFISFFGSSNFDIRSFALNFEINLVLYGAKETTALRAEQMRFIEQSAPLTKEEWGQRPRLVRVGQNVAKLFSPLL